MWEEKRKLNEIKVDIRGEEWTVVVGAKAEDYPALKGLSGFADYTVRKIVIKEFIRTERSVENVMEEIYYTLRHELVHAFLYESGLGVCTCAVNAWAENEEMIDWFAFMMPKIMDAFMELKRKMEALENGKK